VSGQVKRLIDVSFSECKEEAYATMANYCLVADMLGFQNIILNSSSPDREKRVNDWIELIQTEAESVGARHQLISDTVFVVTESDADGLRRVLTLAQRLLERGLDQSFPLRGAVTHGDVTWSPQLVFGPAIVEAYRLETDQDWMGVTCSPSIPHKSSCDDLLVTYPVPMKSGPVQLRPALRWSVPRSYEISAKTVRGGLTSTGDLMQHSWSRKMINTALFGAYVRLVRLCGTNPKFFVGFNALQLVEAMLTEAEEASGVVETWQTKLREGQPSLFVFP
jgi:hypothetical protein